MIVDVDVDVDDDGGDEDDSRGGKPTANTLNPTAPRSSRPT